MKKVYIEPEISLVVIGKVMDTINPASKDGDDFTNRNNTFDEGEVISTNKSSLWDSVDD